MNFNAINLQTKPPIIWSSNNSFPLKTIAWYTIEVCEAWTILFYISFAFSFSFYFYL